VKKLATKVKFMFQYFLKFLQSVIDNQDSQNLTHKEVKFLAQGFLLNFDQLQLNPLIANEIHTLLIFINSGSKLQPIPHYQRAFYAYFILKLIEENKNDKHKLPCEF
jgi:hypothetical protein